MAQASVGFGAGEVSGPLVGAGTLLGVVGEGLGSGTGKGVVGSGANVPLVGGSGTLLGVVEGLGCGTGKGEVGEGWVVDGRLGAGSGTLLGVVEGLGCGTGKGEVGGSCVTDGRLDLGSGTLSAVVVEGTLLGVVVEGLGSGTGKGVVLSPFVAGKIAGAETAWRPRALALPLWPWLTRSATSGPVSELEPQAMGRQDAAATAITRLILKICISISLAAALVRRYSHLLAG